MINSMRKMWRRKVPYAVRVRLSDWRQRRKTDQVAQEKLVALAIQIQRLNAEIDELRRDQRRVAQLMDVIEQLVVQADKNIDYNKET